MKRGWVKLTLRKTNFKNPAKYPNISPGIAASEKVTNAIMPFGIAREVEEVCKWGRRFWCITYRKLLLDATMADIKIYSFETSNFRREHA